MFSYLSSIVFKRERWNQYQIDPKLIGTAYSHVYMLLSFIPDGCELVYIREPLVHCRGQNDSFESEGIVKRIMLDIEGYTLLARECPAVKHVKKEFLAVLQRERPVWKTLVFIRIRTNSATWKQLVSSYRKADYRLLPVKLIGMSKPLLLTIKALRNMAPKCWSLKT